MDFGTLDNFEDEIDRTILARGRAYYYAGDVIALEEVDTGVWEAIVRGSEKYEVVVEIDEEGDITHTECDCPYDWGGPCKHIVATLFAIRDGETISSKPVKKASKQNEKVDASLRKRVDAVMAQLSAEAAKEFLREQLTRDALLERLFLLRFENLAHSFDPGKVEHFLQESLKTAIGNERFFDPICLADLLHKLNAVKVFADAWLVKGDYPAVMAATKACIETAIAAQRHTTARDKSLTAHIMEAVDRLERIAENKTRPPEATGLAFNLCVTLGKHHADLGLSSCIRIFKAAESLAESEVDGKRLVQLFDDLGRSGCFGTEVHSKKLDLIRKWMGGSTELEFLMSHLEVAEFRQIAIDRAIADQNYLIAAQLAKNGLDRDGGYSPQKATMWRMALLKIAVIQGEIPASIQQAKAIFWTEFSPRIETYKQIKAVFPVAIWPVVAGELVTSRGLNGGPLGWEMLGKIYVLEGWHDRLITLLQKSPTPLIINEFEKFLVPEYNTTLVSLWEAILIKHLERCNSRTAYVTACQYLRRIRELGGHETFDYLLKFIKEEFGRRPAFMGELNRL
jgi:hypothetical protein